MRFTVGIDHGVTITGADISLFSKVEEDSQYGVFFARLEPFPSKVVGGRIVESCDGWRTVQLNFRLLFQGLKPGSAIEKDVLLLVTNKTNSYLSCNEIKKVFYIDSTTDITDFPIPVTETEPKKSKQSNKESEQSEERSAISSKTAPSPSPKPEEDTSTIVTPSSKPEETGSTTTEAVTIPTPKQLTLEEKFLPRMTLFQVGGPPPNLG